MKTATRKLLKFFGIAFGGLLGLFAAWLALLIYPGVLFAHSAELDNLRIYANDELGGVETVLERIDRALRTSEIYDESIDHRIFLGHNNRAFRALQAPRDLLLRRTFGRGCGVSCNVSLPPYVSHSMTFYRPIIETDSLVDPDGTLGVDQSLSRTLTHEVVHTLIIAELGLKGVARAPMWKQEGYADYVAASASILANSEYRIRRSVERILDQDLSWLIDANGESGRFGYGCQRFGVIDDEEGRRWNTCYYLARVMVEYSLDVKGMSFRELMNSDVTDAGTLAELFTAYESGELQ